MKKLALLLLSVSLAFGAIDSNVSGRMDDFKRLTQFLFFVENHYVEDQNLTGLVDNMIIGTLAKLDPHSSFFKEDDLRDFKTHTTGKFGGLGMTVGVRDGAVMVIAPMEGTPAFKGGILAGDYIVKVNDKITIDMTLNETVDLMRGDVGTKVKITLSRKTAPKPIVVELIRDTINVISVRSRPISDGMVYLKVNSFDEKVTADAIALLTKAKPVKGIILDMRNNPGGLLDQAISLSDLFIKSGIIVKERTKMSKEDIDFNASKPSEFENTPIVVLVNEGSASASEIVAGALQDHKRAIILGQKTFGKGSVQTVFSLGKSQGIKLTVGKYYLPSGRTIQAVGITPDVIVVAGKVPQASPDEFSIKEADLKAHLKNEIGEANAKKMDLKTDPLKIKLDSESRKDAFDDTEINDDLQLKSGIDILKTRIILGN